MFKKKEKEANDVRSVSKKVKAKGQGSSIALAARALALTLAAFGGLLFAQRYFSDEVVYQNVLVAKTAVPAKVLVTEENVGQYFQLKSVNVLDSNSGALSDASAVVGKKSLVAFCEGEMVSEKDFTAVVPNECADPVEITVEIPTASNADGGKIRAGDVVNLSVLFTREVLGMDSALESVSSLASMPESYYEEPAEADVLSLEGENLLAGEGLAEAEALPTPTPAKVQDSEPESEASAAGDANGNGDLVLQSYARYVFEDLVVVDVQDGSGKKIESYDTESQASIFTFVVDRADELRITEAICGGSDMRLSKVAND